MLKSKTLMIASLLFAAAHVGRADIMYTCDASIGAALCGDINSIVGGIYNSTFTNVTANIFITYDGAVPGLPPLPPEFAAGSLRILSAVDYNTWRSALIGAEADANDQLAVKDNVPATEPAIFNAQNGLGIALTNANERALGMTATIGTNDSWSANCTIGTTGCYDGIINMSNSVSWYFRNGPQPPFTLDFYTAVEHETDEILGTLSCVSFNFICEGYAAPVDFFRYSAPGVRTLTSGVGSAYFSIDGGATSVAPYNNDSAFGDLGDWDPSVCSVQSSFICGNEDIGPKEITVLDAIGYNLHPSAVPEVKSSLLLLSAIGCISFIRRRRSYLQRSRHTPSVG